MKGASVVAAGAVSAHGLGRAAYAVAPVGAPAVSAIRRDPELAAAGLARPLCARAPAELGIVHVPAPGDRATALLLAALAQVCAELDTVRPGWRALRLGVALGTSSGGMLTAERFFAALERPDATPGELAALGRGATYFAPLDDALRALGLAPRLRQQTLAACASSTVALGLGLRWLARGACDLVLAGGYDAVSLFVAAGFEALRATTASAPQPFRLGRDGMALGEGAAVLALVPASATEAGAAFHVTGFGASCDAVHITAPDREGRGLARAARAALGDAGLEAAAVGLVSAHGTSTPYNDAMEARVVAELFAPPAGPPVVHPFKAEIGHTLGAAGALETLAAGEALGLGIAPAAAGDAPQDPEAPVRQLAVSEACELGAALKLSAAFGGVCAALVLESARARAQPPGGVPARVRAVRPVYVGAHVVVGGVERPALAAALGWPLDRVARVDELGQLGLAAGVALVAALGGPEALAGAGVVAGQALGPLDVNARFAARIAAKGPRGADPRLFPATSPNAVAGHVAIAWGLTGPSFAVGAGLDAGLEALLAAAELVAAGDADRMVVVAADEAGPTSRRWVEVVAPGRTLARGAVALLLTSERSEGARLVDLDADPSLGAPTGCIGHLGLEAWLRERRMSDSDWA
ncbi:MAG: 3-oxoacyl-ACP synthase [Polyangiaceae bacterium]|nr:3-oxoacyl-ACP synthase [Polyangiaceae bacterium]